jgi:hypothetical protein
MATEGGKKMASLNRDFLRLIPEGATHALVEERLHRGEHVYAVVAIVPDGMSLPLNAYATEESANSVAEAVNQHLAA